MIDNNSIDMGSTGNNTTEKSVKSSDATVVRRGDGTFRPTSRAKRLIQKDSSLPVRSENELRNRGRVDGGMNKNQVENNGVKIKCHCYWLKFWKRNRLRWV